MRPRTGHLYRLGKTWYCRVTYTDDTGRRRVVKRTAPTKNEVRALAQKLIREIDAHGQLDGARMTFDELANRFEEVKLIPPRFVGEKQIAGYRSLDSQQRFLAVLRSHFGRRLVRNINHADLEAFKLRRLETKTKHETQRSIASVHRELEMLRRVLNFAVRQNWLDKNPFQMGEPLISKADETKRTRILSFDEEARLLAVCEGPRAHLRALVIVAIDTAMRKGELLKLRWDWIDLENRMIHLPAPITKTQRARDIAMTGRVEAELRRIWEQSPKSLDLTVFGIEAGFKRAWATALEKAEIEDLHFHDLRHSAASRLIAAGVPHVEVMKVVGHETLDMLARYVNVDHDTIRRAADALDAHVARNLKKAEENETTEFVN
ncbi:MAG: site-specific integrase [Blastocatellales bacterium]|nr:site-specific integrase [Blastocatellales bacterium]